MEKYSFKCGDLVKILDPDTGRSDTYPCPAIFIDNSIPYYLEEKRLQLEFITIKNNKVKKFYKVYLIDYGVFEWFDLPYWDFKKVS
jgi:hypothetical protein